MIRKGSLLFLAFFIAIPLFFASCGGSNSKSDSGSPDVIISPDTYTDTNADTDTDTGTGDSATGGDSSDGTGTSGDGEGTDNTSNLVVILNPGSNGKLTVNHEELDPSVYNSGNTTAVDDNGTCTVKITDDGKIIIIPSDGTIEGTYTVTITTDDRVYEVVVTVTVSSTGEATVSEVSSSSTPAGTSMVLNLSEGQITLADGSILDVTSDGMFTDGYELDDSIASITATDKNGNAVSVSVDPVTGDIITSGQAEGPYIVVITTSDGTVYTITTDADGAVQQVVENGSTLMVDLADGSLTVSGTTLVITGKNSDGTWSLADGVVIISATAADGAVTIDPSNIWINMATGDIMLLGTDPAVAQAGPYEIKISIDGKTYIIKTDASGAVTEMLPGNTLLALDGGYVTMSGNNILQMAVASEDTWSLASNISNLTATGADGQSVAVYVNGENGNIITPDGFTDPVTIVFNYTNASGNVITYTLIVANGSLSSYQAEITNPGPDFDFSTVTNIKITLKVVDEATGAAIGQASIRFIKDDNTDTWQGFTDDSGLSIFAATVDTASKTAFVKVTREGYENVECAITGIGRLVEFGKKISMKAVAEAEVEDSDGDGVPDADDDFPEDPTAAKEITGVYTLAFEDLYPYKGDADFNDLVVSLTIVERIDSQNRLMRIDLKTKLLASGAGYTNKFAINIYGKQYILISNPKASTVYTLGSYSNTDTSAAYHECEEFVHAPILFEGGIDRSTIAPMPYDPYILCNGSTRKQAHLPFVETSFTGNVIDSDGFPWAILVPADWAWPYEKGSIFNAYPQFDDWYISEGESNKEWYLAPDTDYTYNR